MNQSINTDSKNSKEPQQKYRLGTVRNLEFGLNLEIVDSFSYLGVTFSSNGSLEAGVQALSDQALRAVNNLLGLFQRVYFDIKTKLALFDALVTPILLYNAEVWGLYDYPQMDKIHIKFCKIFLGVRQQTPNYAVYGELGRFPLSGFAKESAAILAKNSR